MVKVKIDTEVLKHALKGINTIINNRLVSLNNNFFNLYMQDKQLLAVGFGQNRELIYKLADLPEDVKGQYHIRYSELAQPLSTLGAMVPEELEFDLENHIKLRITAGTVKLNLTNYSINTDDTINFSIENATKYNALGYGTVLRKLGSIVDGASQGVSTVVVTSKDTYLNADALVISRMHYDFKGEEHELDIPSIKTINEVLDGVTETAELELAIDDATDTYTLKSDNVIYRLNSLPPVNSKQLIGLFDNFKEQSTITFDPKQFITYLRLAKIYISNTVDDAVLSIKDNVMQVIPGNAYQEEDIKTVGDDSIEESYSDAKMPVNSSIDAIDISIPLDATLATVGVLSDMSDMSEFTLKVSEQDQGYFEYTEGGTLIGISVID